jgi:DNA-binding SARP family transcriptional activator
MVGGPREFAVHTYGSLRVCSASHCEPVRQWHERRASRRSVYLLLARLLLSANRWQSRTDLIDAVWPEGEYPNVEAEFYSTLRHLRKRLGAIWTPEVTWIEREVGHYRLRRDQRLTVDSWGMDKFESSLMHVPSRDGVALLERLVAITAPGYLADAPDAVPWIVAKRHAAEQLTAIWALRAAEEYQALRMIGQAERVLWRTLADFPHSVLLQEALLRLYGDRNDPAARRIRTELQGNWAMAVPVGVTKGKENPLSTGDGWRGADAMAGRRSEN